MDYKRQTEVLSVIFVLVGMVFLVSAITEKAQATIDATAFTPSCCFSHITAHFYAGSFLLGPGPPGNPFGPIKNELRWITKGDGFYGNERGYVAADVGPSHFPVKFHFNNPASGKNTCAVEPIYAGRCTISQAVHAQARFTVVPILSDANGGDANVGDEGDGSGDNP